jgi:hypothetical protein
MHHKVIKAGPHNPAAELAPMLIQRQVQEDIALRHLQDQTVMNDRIMKRTEEQSSVMAFASAQASEKAKSIRSTEGKEAKSSTTYTITYYNPEIHKAEVLSDKSDIKIKDEAVKGIEESVASQSLYPIYSYIGAPLMKVETVPWMLEQILSERDYGTPPPSGGASIVPVKLVELKESEMVARKKIENEMRSALEVSIVRKENSEIRLGEQIIVMEQAVDALRIGENIDNVLIRLPPLSRLRYVLLMKKRKAPVQIVIRMLLRDITFLKSFKKKLSLFSTDDLVGMLKALRALKKD